jgi:hypothetical protein
MTLITEIYQFLFISSIIFMVYIIGDLFIKMYGRFKLKEETRFILTKSEKILLWLSLATFISYIIT